MHERPPVQCTRFVFVKTCANCKEFEKCGLGHAHRDIAHSRVCDDWQLTEGNIDVPIGEDIK